MIGIFETTYETTYETSHETTCETSHETSYETYIKDKDIDLKKDIDIVREKSKKREKFLSLFEYQIKFLKILKLLTGRKNSDSR